MSKSILSGGSAFAENGRRYDVAVRVWDVPPHILCRAHLLGEHRELHATWTILTEGKRGYARHPEVLRWQGKLRALFLRHDALVEEMTARGYNHRTPLDEVLATGASVQDAFVDAIDVQFELLRAKGCACRVEGQPALQQPR
jgi:hypothetical protein